MPLDGLKVTVIAIAAGIALALAGWGMSVLLGAPALGAGTPDAGSVEVRPIGEAPGGAVSRRVQNRTAFSLSAPELPLARVRVFFFGNRLFNTNWTTAPASVESFDGLGPIFNRVSCSGCHVRDGRGRPPVDGEDRMLSMLVRLSVPGDGPHGGPKAHPTYGDQLGDRAIQGVEPEGRAVIEWREVEGEYGDGTPYTLRRPELRFEDLAYGPLGDDIMISPRVAPAVFGLGLLEAIPEAAILAGADPEDENGDGISGRPNRVHSIAADEPALGRFGWKANQPSLRQQNAGAAFGDIGLTTSLFPQENCMEGQVACAAAQTGGAPEVSDEFLDKLTFYTQTLAVPVRRNVDDPEVERGETLFHVAGCAGCHTPTFTTGEHEVDVLEGQTIHPFTDLLLHDMGEGLADGRPDFAAGGREWRTPPLWGIGLVETVNDHALFLHDGRARGLAEAILWHGGEADAAKEAFRTMDAADRAALIAFLRSL